MHVYSKSDIWPIATELPAGMFLTNNTSDSNTVLYIANETGDYFWWSYDYSTEIGMVFFSVCVKVSHLDAGAPAPEMRKFKGHCEHKLKELFKSPDPLTIAKVLNSVNDSDYDFCGYIIFLREDAALPKEVLTPFAIEMLGNYKGKSLVHALFDTLSIVATYEILISNLAIGLSEIQIQNHE